jgi:serine/threonine-protein kinase ATR
LTQNNPASDRTGVSKLVAECTSMTNQLLDMCDFPVGEEAKTLSMQKHFPRLFRLGRSDLIIPLQESLTASLPPTSSLESDHQPFPPNAPTFAGQFFHPDLHSLFMPRQSFTTRLR